MHMMFIRDKGLGNDRQTLINFIWKFLVSVREALFEFFITQSVFEDTHRQTFQILLPRGFLLTR